ncbi:prolyl oligopeptidase family serine peptidase [Nonomuraea soli]|uniref:Dipeptidyl aminopeptidase/acylaminoacyl peptidase n=1 Tax=Nonomuraea soli TaxID=1032476 RepID=A0A7W0HP23_9ACTN|nr:prolyl oligopeptidase family serine peptidase [Nonomuraea soli]MBA2890410.1 dipeptidyl aminopeptidase/acylaminoacyl peptidase [Nonomuraea soli]
MSIEAIDVARTDGGPLWVSAVSTPEGLEAWWDEPRPHEGGRRCVVRRTPDGRVEDVLPPGWNARNRVIEYGGRSWLPMPDGGLVFTNWADQRVYRLAGGEITPMTPEGTARYADLYRPPGSDEIWAVREDHDERDIVALDGTNVTTLVKAQHFVMNPRLSPDGTMVAWIGWDHPNMPWDGTELCVAFLDDPSSRTVIAGGPGEAVVQAEWRDTGSLYAVTDPTGWWNLHVVGLDGDTRNLAPLPMEFGDAVWKLGNTWFAVWGDKLVTLYGTADGRRLGVLDPETGKLSDLGGQASWWSSSVAVAGATAVGVAASPYEPSRVTAVDLASGAHTALSAAKPVPARELVPVPEPTVVEGVHTHLYRARDTPGPWLVFVHGGPTSSRPPVLDLEIAYFTTRGYGVAQVNYGGSTGYGRAYRERLRHQWGVVDVQDCAKVARGLVAMGLADASRIAVRGGSAGGWTTVAALAHTDVFAAGVAHYAITDPESWAAETHDFESRYLDGLVGPLPETRERYIQRSPLLNASRVNAPCLMMHGLEDAIVDVGQAERFVAELDRHGKEWALLTFPGEQHGWRREETIVAVLEAELDFYEENL